MIELTNALKATLYERAKKPFTGTFALAWTVINWRILFTLFFVNEKNLNGLSKVDFIEQCYLNWWDNLFLPLITTLALIFLLPIFNLGALFIKKIFDDIEFKNILKKEPVDGKRYATLLDDYKSQQRNFSEEINTLNVRNDNNMKQIESLTNKWTEENKRALDAEKQSKSHAKEIEGINNKIKHEFDEQKETINNLNSELKKNEIEFKNIAKIVNDYRNIVQQYKNEYGESSDKNIKSLEGKLFNLKIRGSSRIKDIMRTPKSK